MSSGRDASSSARKMLAIRLVFCRLSRRPSPVAKKRSRALSLNDRITPICKPKPYNCQALPYEAAPSFGFGNVNLHRERYVSRAPQGCKSAAFGGDIEFQSGAPGVIGTFKGQRSADQSAQAASL